MLMMPVWTKMLGLAVIGLCCAAPARADILIGLAQALTGSIAFQGEQMQRGAAQAVDDLNAQGGVLGQQVRMVVADDACDGDQAVAVANKLVADGVVFVVGHGCSGASIPASAVYEEAGLPMISPASTNPALTDAGRVNVFRVAGRDDVQGTIAGDYLFEHWAGHPIAILHDGLAYGEGLARQTKARLNEHGVTEVIYDVITPGEPDYSDVLTRLREADVEVLYYGGYAAEAGLLVSQASDIGYSLQLIAGDGVIAEDFWFIAGAVGNGTLLTFSPDPRGNPEAAAAVERFRAAGFEPLGYSLHAYAAVQAWAEAAEQAGSAEPKAVIDSLHAGQFETVLGTIGFDDKGDVTGLMPFVWYRWMDGELEPVN
jgi:branched-chain amino acid transport system substrate-binding protein